MELRMNVVEPGYRYELHNFEPGVQDIFFIKREADESGILKTIQEGTTNEALLQVLIDRIRFLNEKMSSPYNIVALTFLEEALEALFRRTEDRVKRGVEGTHNN